MNINGSTVLLAVRDPEASSRFFTSHLGFREVLVTGGFIQLSRDDAGVDLAVLSHHSEHHRTWRQPAAPPDVMVSFAVTGLAAEHERLRREGVRITMPLRQEPWGEWALQLTDPNGIVIQLVEWMPPAGA
ncbi:VOC family protein [Streptomyces sp. NPDC056465]|uniref:VOC family protein n=1 Tax=unclassified Streptomyces TaxID=2593676 RepID=UPI0035E2C987